MDSMFAAELQQAWELHQQGQFAPAEDIYRKVLGDKPRHALALFLLGRLELDQGRNEQAAEHLATAIESDGSKAIFHATRARALRALGDGASAVMAYRRAIDLEPESADYHVNLGNVQLARKQATEAVECYKRAIALDPQLAEAYTCLGAVLEHQGRLGDAVTHHRQAISLRPDFAEAHHNLGTALWKLDQAEEALACFTRAAELQPQWDAPHANAGHAYQLMGRDAEALACFERALELAPRFADHHASLANLLWSQGRPQEALDRYEQALALDPDNAGAWYGRALVNLSLGRLSEGWTGFEHRFECHPSGTLQLPEPRWDGSPLGAATLLVHAEWGHAETIQFVRLVKLLGPGNIVLAVQPALIALLNESGFEHVVSCDEALPDFDVQVPLLSLPRTLKIDRESIPAQVPYVDVDAKRVDIWHTVLAPYQGFRIGIAWQDNTRHRLSPARSIPLEHFARLAEVPGVTLISLQDEEPEQPSRGATSPKLARLDELHAGPDGLVETAAAMKNLDLVIVCDSALAHLAGALGVPAWVALGGAPNWRWLLERDDSPWYPTLRLFRQESRGDWAGVFQRMATELADLVRQD